MTGFKAIFENIKRDIALQFTSSDMLEVAEILKKLRSNKERNAILIEKLQRAAKEKKWHEAELKQWSKQMAAEREERGERGSPYDEDQ